MKNLDTSGDTQNSSNRNSAIFEEIMNENSVVNKVALPRYSQHFIKPNIAHSDFAREDSPKDKYHFVKKQITTPKPCAAPKPQNLFKKQKLPPTGSRKSTYGATTCVTSTTSRQSSASGRRQKSIVFGQSIYQDKPKVPKLNLPKQDSISSQKTSIYDKLIDINRKYSKRAYDEKQIIQFDSIINNDFQLINYEETDSQPEQDMTMQMRFSMVQNNEIQPSEMVSPTASIIQKKKVTSKR